MKSVFAAMAFVPVLLLAQGIEGNWQGTLEAGQAKLRLVLKVTRLPDGTLKAAMDSLDQGATDLAVDTITAQEGTVRFEMKHVGGSYEGKLAAGGNEMSGTWSQGGNSLPLTLKRGGAGPTPTAKGRVLTAAERDFAITHLERTRKLFLDSIEGLSEAQWKFKPAADRWSIAEVAEHIAVSEDFLFETTTNKILKIPPSPDRPEKSGEEARASDEQILKRVTDRSKPANAPEPLRPSGRFSDRAAVVAHFNKSRDRTIQYARTTQDDLRNHSTPSPLGNPDAYQFLLLTAGHAERHTAQINEVKTSAGYPK